MRQALTVPSLFYLKSLCRVPFALVGNAENRTGEGAALGFSYSSAAKNFTAHGESIYTFIGNTAWLVSLIAKAEYDSYDADSGTFTLYDFAIMPNDEWDVQVKIDADTAELVSIYLDNGAEQMLYSFNDFGNTDFDLPYAIEDPDYSYGGGSPAPDPEYPVKSEN